MHRYDANPYIAARHEFDNVFSHLARGKRNWQLMAGVAMGLLAIMAIAYIRLASSARITPYVVEVDRLGRAAAFGPAEALKVTDRRVVIAQLTQFIRNVRSIAPSDGIQREFIRQAYAFVDQRGAEFLNTYFADPTHDPRALRNQVTRLVEVSSVLAVPNTNEHAAQTNGSKLPSVWKITWTERTLPTTTGGSPTIAAWEGYVTIRVAPPTRTDGIQDNPLGVFITAITWTEINRGPVTAPPSP